MNLPNECRIDSFNESLVRVTAPPAKFSLSYNVVSMASGVLLVADMLCLLLAASLSTLFYTTFFAPLSFAGGFEQAAWVAAVLAPFILFDQRFGAAASRGRMSLLIRSYALRFTLFSSVVLGLGILCQALDTLSSGWLAMWFVSGLVLTSLTRVVTAQVIRHLQQQGVLTEVVAVVGAGPIADRLVQALRQTRADSIELLGIFDDSIEGPAQGMIKPAGTLEQLLELGKTRKIDWIIVTLPPTAKQQVLSVVQRLKALSVPIGLCPQHVELAVPYRTIDYVGGSVPVSLLSQPPLKGADALIKAAEDFLPRWLITLALLPLMALEALVRKPVKVAGAPRQPTAPLTLQFDNYDLAGFTDVAASFGQNRYGYVVTPNADHMIRLHENVAFRALYAAASYVLLDSRFLSKILRISKGMELPVCTGSDLTAKLFSDVITADDKLVLIGGTDTQAEQLRARYGVRGLVHFNPPMGFINDPAALETCLSFIESHSPFRFCMLAVGSPQQEIVAQQLKVRGIARGLTLCIGASINFLTGDERRAPVWMQQCGMEWLFRLMQAPGRMAKRYLVRGPRVFGLLRNAQIVLRKSTTPVLRLVPSLPQTTPSATIATAAAEPVRLRLAVGRQSSAHSRPGDLSHPGAGATGSRHQRLVKLQETYKQVGPRASSPLCGQDGRGPRRLLI